MRDVLWSEVGWYALAAVRPPAPVRHTYQTLRVDLSPADVLVLELAAVDAGAAGPVTFRDVAALHHELVDDAVEGRQLVGQGLGDGRRRVGARCEGTETVADLVSTRLGTFMVGLGRVEELELTSRMFWVFCRRRARS